MDPALPLAWGDVQRHGNRMGRFEGSIEAQRETHYSDHRLRLSGRPQIVSSSQVVSAFGRCRSSHPS